MKKLKLLSWNVNGIRAAAKKGFADWLVQSGADIIGIQETKAHPAQLTANLTEIPNYQVYFSSAEKKGYSGVALYTKETPRDISYHLGEKRFDCEGRVIRAQYDNFLLYNIYFPNGKASTERLQYKYDFYEYFLAKIKEDINQGLNPIVCGDVNTAHTEIDLARPKENEKVSGFLPAERAWIDRFLQAGFKDSFRVFNKAGGHYTWWDYKTRARERNVGWRIDYFFVHESLAPHLQEAFILNEIPGSDHCPLGIGLVF